MTPYATNRGGVCKPSATQQSRVLTRPMIRRSVRSALITFSSVAYDTKSRCAASTCKPRVEVGEGVREILDVIELIHVLRIVENALRRKQIVRDIGRLATMRGVPLEKIDEKLEFAAHVTTPSDSLTAAANP